MYNFKVSTFEKADGGVITLGDIGVNEYFCYSVLSFLKPETAGTRTFEVNVNGETQHVSGFMYYFATDLEGTAFEGQPGWYYFDENAELHPFNSEEVPAGSMFYVEGGDDPESKGGQAAVLIPASL